MHRKAFQFPRAFYLLKKFPLATFDPLSPFFEPKIYWLKFSLKLLPCPELRVAGLNSPSHLVSPLRACHSPRWRPPVFQPPWFEELPEVSPHEARPKTSRRWQ